MTVSITTGDLHHPAVELPADLLSGLSEAQRATLGALSALLDVGAAALLAELRAGADLGALLSARGVDVDQLGDAVEQALLVTAGA